MSNPFFETSKNIANQFLQNIVFIDDKAYTSPDKTNHDFDALKISQVFAESQKVCAVYKPQKVADIDNLSELAKKADVTIIDWQINIEQEKVENEEEDAEADDPRGPYTKKIIRSIMSDQSSGQRSLKLIIVYTGEIDLEGITNDIFDDLSEFGITNLKKELCLVQNDDSKIFVIAKPDKEEKGESKFKHKTELKEFVINYEELPDFILYRFTEMTNGLLSNFVLNSLTVLRRNNSRLIQLFSRNVDTAFLTHKSLLPNPEDADDHIIDVVGSELKSMLKGNNVSNPISMDNISNYIDAYYNDEVNFSISEKEKYKSIEIPEKLSKDNLKTIIRNGISNFFIRKSDPFEEVQLFEKSCHKTLIESFSTDRETGHRSNIRFASLTTLKSFYNPEYLPVLTQGTILREDKVNTSYWLCIQPKCDSVRIHTKKRDFLVLRLIEVDANNKFDLVTDHETFLKIDYNIYNSKLLSFVKTGNGQITPTLGEDGFLRFLRGDNQKMIWIGELKNDFAQHISNTFATRLSRVGMDHSEWLRRS